LVPDFIDALDTGDFGAADFGARDFVLVADVRAGVAALVSVAFLVLVDFFVAIGSVVKLLAAVCFTVVAFFVPVFLSEAPFDTVRLVGFASAAPLADALVGVERLVVEDDSVADVRAGRSVVRAGDDAPVAFLTAVFRAGMCPP
jgi:hypothetical protein